MTGRTGDGADPAARGLPRGATIAYSVPQVGINLMGSLTGTWLTFLYCPPDGEGRAPLTTGATFAMLMLLGRVVDAISDPLIGYWSDRTRSRWGRRLPWIVLGTPFLGLSYAAMWLPPRDHVSAANDLWLGGALVAYWIFFTVVIGPYSALLPEIARSTRDRVRLSTTMALFTVGGIALGFLAGPAQSRFPAGLTLAGWSLPTGIQAYAMASAIVVVVSIYATPLGVRETPHDASKEVPPGLIAGVVTAFKNPAFIAFLGLAALVQLGAAVFQVGLPYLATVVLERDLGQPGLVKPGGGEGFTGVLQAVLFVTALAALPLMNPATRRFGKKRLMIASTAFFGVVLLAVPAITMFPDPAVPMLVACVLLGLPVACVLVVVAAVGADVVDYDERRTGVRREGTYSGAGALISKAVLGFANIILVGALWFGSSRTDPQGILLLGPISGVLILLGTWVYAQSPVES